MRKLFGVVVLAAMGVLLAAASPSPTSRVSVPLLDRLNGSPAFIGHMATGADGGTMARVDAGVGNAVKVQCYSACCVCAAVSCSCGNIAGASVGLSTTGELLQANGVSYFQLTATNGMLSVSSASGSFLLDGGVGVEADGWVMQ